MTWYETQTAATSVSFTEWNNMVTWIRKGNPIDQTATPLTLDDTHTLLTCDTTSNVIAITLPEAATSKGKIYTIYLDVDGGNNVTVTCAGADVLNDAGNTIATLADVKDWLRIMAVADDRWIIISDNGVAYS